MFRAHACVCTCFVSHFDMFDFLIYWAWHKTGRRCEFVNEKFSLLILITHIASYWLRKSQGWTGICVLLTRDVNFNQLILISLWWRRIYWQMWHNLISILLLVLWYIIDNINGERVQGTCRFNRIILWSI